MKKSVFLLIVFFLAVDAVAQRPVLIHSHNDYTRTAPFWEAYSQHVGSIETDVHYVDGKLLVGHDVEDLREDCTLKELYVDPIVTVFRRNGGRMWMDSDEKLQLMVDLKSAAEPELGAVVRLLSGYPDVFGEEGVRVTITGNLPEPEDFGAYPDFVSFDGDIDRTYTAEQLKRVALFSVCFSRFSEWNGKGSIVPTQLRAIRELVDKVHSMGKPIRFWAAPEGITVYYTFYNLGVDCINTDKPVACAAFFSDWANKNFSPDKERTVHEGTTGTRRLDKLTRSFKGFRNDRLQLSRGIGTYVPTYRNDGSGKKIKNVILLIGDGMCINQMTAAAYANDRQLSLFNMRFMGLHFNNAKDAFTTDSAAGGSALGTGMPHDNRHVSAGTDGSPAESLAEFFHDRGKATASVSLGNVADATPAVFYAHTVERDSTELITRQMLASHADLICGSGLESFCNRRDGLDMEKEFGRHGWVFTKDLYSINARKGRVICVDDRLGSAAEESNLHLLADLSKETFRKMQERSRKGFFAMIEGAKIDYAGHSNCLPGSILEQLSFDLAVQEALKFADGNGETLVIVTSDHETGGLVLLDGDLSQNRIMGIYTTDDHTPAMIPVFAYGPGAQHFIGVMHNTDIPRRIKKLF